MADCTMKWTLKYGRKEKDIVAEGHCHEYYWTNKMNNKNYAMRNLPNHIRNWCAREQGIFNNLCQCRRIPLKKCHGQDAHLDGLTPSQIDETHQHAAEFLRMVQEEAQREELLLSAVARGKKKRKTRKVSKHYSKRKLPKKRQKNKDG